MGDYEDNIIQHYTSEDDETPSYIQICTNVAKLCKKEKNNTASDVDSESHSNDEL